MRLLIILTALCSLIGCGGGSSDDSGNAGNTSICQRTDINSQVYCAMQQDYLWYRDMPSGIDPGTYSSPAALIQAVAAPQDRYSFILTRQEYEDRFINATFFGYGFSSIRADNDTTLQIAFVYDDGSAAQNGLRRGDKIIEIEGVSVAKWLSDLDAGTVTSNDIYGPNEAGVMRNFVWRKPDGSQLMSDFIKSEVTTNTVMHRSVRDEGNKRIGYLVFNTFIELSETELEQAFSEFVAQGVNELVLDLRYNGGGLIRVANQLSSQIARNAVQGEVFLKYQYNDKNTAKNSTTLFSLGAGRSALNLDRVIVLTTASSCSSSELVINSLAPFIEVVQIGSTTCGKPVGQQPDIIADYVLFAINFQTVNALGQGEYFDGLQPNCPVTDAITGDWGVAEDPLYAEALSYIATGSCSDTTQAFAALQSERVTPKLVAPWMMNNEQ
ncbi:S41 family peptidase [Rheinheimera maricola]|uniref:PDZ domain-containing protein n=1 Tax=Rheinheimera maricola TaxID=2793282 RepID=A0ABS7XCL3_9GAMM|nr:S41 family peptidase [Rheinheimera maricola]MBZ9612492.1 PDZ domain-containing protein [Rheinheimera maricola]